MANFQDPAGIANYYTFTEYVNGQAINQTFNFSDRLSDGKYIRRQLFNDSSYINPGDQVSYRDALCGQSGVAVLQYTGPGQGQ